MGLIARIRRWRYVYSWRLRYWWLDTRQGEIAHRVAMAVFVLIALAQVLRMANAAAQPVTAAPTEAIWPWWVIQIIIMLVSAAISYALAPKPEAPKPQEMDAPTTEDGLAAKHHFGTVWVGDEFLLAWKMTGTEAIKSGGGKK